MIGNKNAQVEYECVDRISILLRVFPNNFNLYSRLLRYCCHSKPRYTYERCVICRFKGIVLFGLVRIPWLVLAGFDRCQHIIQILGFPPSQSRHQEIPISRSLLLFWSLNLYMCYAYLKLCSSDVYVFYNFMF